VVGEETVRGQKIKTLRDVVVSACSLTMSVLFLTASILHVW